ncbi:uncharacterized protein EI90DRAFT_3124552 [Cantharellus anzutake]|uniref:uncharacterized protein n=1 Tax=Cantharellus anzutake TaxID=1750568 RepID=UPI001903C9DD|nr:uncharacterized protein EI90DRAFT_3124552 [Cantharellus anzutake]KAF8330137.1 hypothetical protein EI90DRAFT_3124552 [Cantharellus anzutake]
MSEILSEEHNTRWDASHYRVRCMGHIVNLAQQAFICALISNTDNLVEPHESDTMNDNEINLTGLEIPLVEGAIVGPLLTRVRALIFHILSYPSPAIDFRSLCSLRSNSAPSSLTSELPYSAILLVPLDGHHPLISIYYLRLPKYGAPKTSGQL